MTDASPANRYLLLDRASDFTTEDKVLYALRNRDIFSGATIDYKSSHHTAAPSSQVTAEAVATSRRWLLRSLDEVKRAVASSTRGLIASSPSTGTAQSGFDSPVRVGLTESVETAALTAAAVTTSTTAAGLAAAGGGTAAGLDPDEDDLSHPDLAEADETLHRGWHDGHMQGGARCWSWPIEVLYQRYHVCIAIDFGAATFAVAENGEVMVDRALDVVEDVVRMLRTTQQTRTQEARRIADWLEGNVADEALRTRLWRQVWCPSLELSVILLNASLDARKTATMPKSASATPREDKVYVPRRLHPTAEGSSDSDDDRAPCAEESTGTRVAVLGPSQTRLSTLDLADYDAIHAASCEVTMTPLLVRHDVHAILRDDGFLPRLRETLMRYETAARAARSGATASGGNDAQSVQWPRSALDLLLEHLVRSQPASPCAACTSLVLVHNTDSAAVQDTLPFIESMLQRRNCIISLVSLSTHTGGAAAAQGGPLTRLLAAVGGFAVNIGYWRAMASERLNRDWCTHFEGARCLAQQLFVQLITRFPVVTEGGGAVMRLLGESAASTVLYDGDHGLPDFVIGGHALALLRSVAAARFNQGWSVVLDYVDEKTAAGLYARSVHHMQGGSLTLYYELNINRPAVYRRVRVTGTAPLVAYFCHHLATAHLSASAATGPSGVATATSDTVSMEVSRAWGVGGQDLLHRGSVIAYLTMLRLLLDNWLRAEQATLPLIDTPAAALQRRGPCAVTAELSRMTDASGVRAEWCDASTVRTAGLFFQVADRDVGRRAEAWPPLLLAGWSKTAELAGTSAHRRPGGAAERLMSDTRTAARAAITRAMTAGQRHVRLSGKRQGEDSRGGVGDAEDDVLVFLSADDLLPDQRYLVQFFHCDEAASPATYAAATSEAVAPVCVVECRVSFLITEGASGARGGVMRAIVRSLQQDLATVPPAADSLVDRSPTAMAVVASSVASEACVVPRLVLHLGPQSSCNARALFLTLASQGRRRTPCLLAVQSRARQERSEQAAMKTPVVQSSATSVRAEGTGSWYARVQQSLRVAYVDSPWQLADAITREWHLACTESASFFGEEVFHYALMRRLCNGYTLLSYRAAPPRAILHLRTDSFAEGGVDVMDVLGTSEIAVAMAGTPHHRAAAPTATTVATALHLRRFIGPYALLQRRPALCRRDIQEDIDLAAALHSFRVLALRRVGGQAGRVPRLPMSEPAESLPSLAMLTLIALREQVLLRFLHPRYTHVISLPVPSALNTYARRQLRAALAALLRALGDRCGEYGVDAFAPALLRHALWPQGDHAGSGATVQVAVLTPLRNQTLLFLLLAQEDMSEDDGDRAKAAAAVSPDGDATRLTVTPCVRVAVAALNAELLHYGLMRHYGPGSDATSCGCLSAEEAARNTRAEAEDRAMPECVPDASVMHALRHLLHTFVSVHTTRALLQGGLPPMTQLTSAEDKAECTERVRELLQCSAHLGLYVRTLDVTYLRAVVQARCGDRDAARVTGRLLTALVQPEVWAEASQASLLLPRRRVTQARRQSNEEGSDDEATALAEPPPVVLKMALVEAAASGATLHAAAVDETPLALSSSVDDVGDALAMVEWWPVLHAASSGGSAPSRDADRCGDEQYAGRHHEAETSADVAAKVAAEEAQSTTRLLLLLFFRTVPVELTALCTRAASPRVAPSSSSIAREVLRSYVIYYTTHKPPRVDFFARGLRDDGATSTFMARTVHPRFAAARWTTSELRHLRECGATQGEGTLPPALGRTLARLTGRLATRIATYALTSSFQAHPFRALRALGQAEGVTDDTCADDALRYLTHRDAAALMARCRGLVGLRDLLGDVVLPALRAARRFEVAVLPVQFTQQTSMYGSIDPTKAARDVFRCCVEEDGMCVLDSGDSYVFVPNANAAAASWWLVVRVLLLRPSSGQRTDDDGHHDADDDEEGAPGSGGGDGRSEAVMYCYPPIADVGLEQADDGMPRALVESLWAYLHRKVTQVSQLHLLKQLRDTQHASAELIPPFWGDQFGTRGRPHEAAAASAASANVTSTYFLHGQNVLEIPIYAKLQHQCKKILSCIASNSARLELIAIYNRDQCFVVADDEQGDVFHYVRLVFVKDATRPVPLTSPVQPVGGADRCPQLLVQLFSATPGRASIQRPLRKLQDFCYLLAVQELQGYLNYVQNTMISFNDLVFLQNQRLQPLAIGLDAALDGDARQVTLDVAERALALLFLHLRENKFKHFRVEDEQTHATSNFVEHYNLEHHGATPTASTRLLAQPEAAEGQAGRLAAAPTACPVLRFVKIVDGVTDVLVSCVVHVVGDAVASTARGAAAVVVVVDRYLTRTPAERYTNGESEKQILHQLDDYVADVSAQLSFAASVQHYHNEGTALRLPEVPTAVHKLLALGARVGTAAESTMLQCCTFALDDITAATLPYLIERLCGALAIFGPSCVQEDVSGEGVRTVHYVPGFPCRWREALQRSVTADETCVYIICGLAVRADETALAATRVVPYTIDGVAITARTTYAAQCAILKEHDLHRASTAALPPCIVLRVSLLQGLCGALFNVRDADFVRSLLGHVVREVALRAGLLHEVLLQRLGYECVNRRGLGPVSASSFSEADLARWCCGDVSHIVPAKPLAIRRDVFRRRVGHVRFCADDASADTATRSEATRPAGSETLVGLLVSLYNAGLVINYAFTLEDAVLLLYNESPTLSLAACEQQMRELVAHGFLVAVRGDEPGAGLRPQRPDMTARLALGTNDGASVRGKEERHGVMWGRHAGGNNYRLAHSRELPADVLIVCDYHRHVTVAHMMAEAQSARAGLRGALAHCDTLWRAGPQNNVHAIARAVVALQARSRQVFGVRVPNFSLLRERWRPEDDVLDPVLPPRARQRQVYGHVVDATLRRYMNFLRRRHPALCLIDLDPDDAVVTQDAVLLNRLRCRYGKVVLHDTAGQEEVILFSPHLWYAVIPLADLLRGEDAAYHRLCAAPLRVAAEGALGAPPATPEGSPIGLSGVFIVEVGLQVTHYALDFFVINGTGTPAAVIAEAAALFRQSLAFDSVLYDLAVEHYTRCLRRRLCALPGEQPIATALAHLLRYYPTAPLQSRHAAAVSAITDGSIMRLRELRVDVAAAGATAPAQLPAADDDGVLYLLPQSRERRVRVRQDDPAVTRNDCGGSGNACPGTVYFDYVGLIDWHRAQLFVLLVADDAGGVVVEASGVAPPEAETLASVSDGLVQAKEWLLSELLDRTQQERLASACGKFAAGCGEEATGRMVAQEPPSFDEYELLRSHTPRVLLSLCGVALDGFPAVLAWRARSMGCDGGDEESAAASRASALQAWLRCLVAALYPRHMVHLLLSPCEASPSAMSSPTLAAPQQNGTNNSNGSDGGFASRPEDGLEASEALRGVRRQLFQPTALYSRVILTLAAPDKAARFVAVEWVYMALAARYVVQEAVLYSACDKAVSSRDGAALTRLTRAERALVHALEHVLVSVMWYVGEGMVV